MAILHFLQSNSPELIQSCDATSARTRMDAQELILDLGTIVAAPPVFQ